ncbi:hypothetical protein EXE10_10745 [Acinetobacter sp. WCHAc060033]|uniref:hypothetical protein n=1 Tax=Acinetobacter sp. WCHAc060033 TaxID=2518624 RepID=UPI001023A009|nr:hypothetical protein [Acinetobacter sp. WCHAc060033]RZG83631.1 hypothetical protein EXE10_10745 [Acinetobacter sp. WCHAc060033]
MALDQIWKRQLTLVTYGNEYLTQEIGFSRWVNHAIFNQHAFGFRDLMTQHLLAQHFQIWLEGLKKQGVYRLSLHSSSLLNDEQNPNANVELLAIPHFIVSHDKQKKTAWIFGKELAEWYSADNDYEAPLAQRPNIRTEVFWRFDLNAKLVKRIEQDLVQPNWDDIQIYTDNELFDSKYAQGFVEPINKDLPYYGLENNDQVENDASVKLSLLPTDYQSDYGHETFYRFDALESFISTKLQHPYDENEQIFSPEEQMNLRHFLQKVEDLKAKFIVKIANHYKTARLTPKVVESPFDNSNFNTKTEQRQSFNSKPSGEHKPGKTSVFALIVITILICLAAYYFGL